VGDLGSTRWRVKPAVHDPMAISAEIAAICRNDPLKWVRAALGIEPTEQQIEGLRAIRQPGAHVSIRSGHGTGKSSFLAWAILWFMSCYVDFKIPCTAPSSHQLHDVLWAELNYWHRLMKPIWRDQIEIIQNRAWLHSRKDTDFAVARTARPDKPEALQGFHARNLLFIVDEASGVIPAVFEVAEGALSTPGASLAMAGNPTRTSGYFYDSHHKMRSTFTTLHWSSVDSPLVSRKYVEDMAKKYGTSSNIYRVRVLGEFPKAEPDQLIPLDLLEAAACRDYVIGFGPWVWGLDVAWMGDDESVLAKRQGYVVSELKKPDQSNLDPVQLASWVADEYSATRTDERPEVINVDTVGIGAGTYAALKQMGLPVRGVNVAESPSSREKYYRLRDELWCNFRDWLETRNCRIPDDADLLGEASCIKYDPFFGQGVTKVESKKDMRKRGLKSPDNADAVCLTFFQAPIIHGAFRAPVNQQKNAVTEYDMFGGN
jgi:phage terminase large subunit